MSDDCLDRLNAELPACSPALLSIENAERIMLKPDEDRLQLTMGFDALNYVFDAFGSVNSPKIWADAADLNLAMALVHRFPLLTWLNLFRPKCNNILKDGKNQEIPFSFLLVPARKFLFRV